MTSVPMSSSTDRIEEQVVLPTSRARVWRALATAHELGAWFGMNLTGCVIAPGAELAGPFTIPGHEHQTFRATIEEVVPEVRLSWRWHPGGNDPSADFSKEPPTLVTFLLEDAPAGGTLLRVIESGFDALPEARRGSAHAGNSRGWAEQVQRRLPRWLEAH